MKRIVKDYDAMPDDIIQQVKQKYPTGYESHLVSYSNAEGKTVTALPFQTADIYYLIRMTVQEARQIIRDDVDFDDDGILRGDLVDDTPDVESEYPGDDDVEDLADTSDDDEEDHIIPTRRRRDDDDYDDDY